MKFGLTQETIDKINSVFEKYPQVDEVIIYGSRAKGDYREGSDIDFTLKGKDLSGELVSSIAFEIEELNTPYLFDVSLFDTLNSAELEAHIKRVGREFYKRKN